MSKVYVVYGKRGLIEDFETWPTKAFLDLNRAERYAIDKQDTEYNENDPVYSPCYTIVPLELDESK